MGSWQEGGHDRRRRDLATGRTTLEAAVRRVRRVPFAGILIAVSTAAAVGLVTATVMPRGPATSMQGLLVIGSGLVVGAVAGACSTSRWAGVAAILGYGVAFEAGRAGAIGPTVDGVRLDNAYGVLALALGRGFHLLIASLALLFGASMGRRLAAPLDDSPWRPREADSERWRACSRRPCSASPWPR